MDFTHQQIFATSDTQNKKAISICLYKSEVFNPDKHIAPLRRFLDEKREGAHKDYDILLFIESGIDVTELGEVEGMYVHLMTSPAPGYYKHFWRYASCSSDFNRYDLICFRGSDTPGMSSDGAKAEAMHYAIGGQAIIGLRNGRDYQGMLGRCSIARTARRSLWNHMRTMPMDREEFWSVDEMELCKWFNKKGIAFPAVVILGNYWDNIKKEWLEDRIAQQQVTVIYRVGVMDVETKADSGGRKIPCDVVAVNHFDDPVPFKEAVALKVTHTHPIGYPVEELEKIKNEFWGEEVEAHIEFGKGKVVWITKN